MKNFYFCIDMGGTYIKAGIVNKSNEIIAQDSFETKILLNHSNCAQSIFEIIQNLVKTYNINYNEAVGIAIGIKGLVDSENGIVISSPLINKNNYPIKKNLEKISGLPVKIANDADIAMLAEQFIGAGIGYKDFIMLTLGTGIGGSIVLNNENLGIKYSAPFEIGHIKIFDNNNKCYCGQSGCYETLGSTNALVEQVKNAIKNNLKHPILNQYSLDEINGKIIFDFIDDDLIQKTLKKYIEYVSIGIINLVNLFKPQIIIIGGAISKQTKHLIEPIEKYVNEHIFLKNMNYTVKIIPAKYTGNAGIIGAKFLFK